MNPKSVLITGANRGIGLEFVKQFLSKKPSHIFATCRNPEAATELKQLQEKNANLHIIKHDMCNDEAHKEVYDYISSQVKDHGLNLLINNAGVLTRAQKLLDVTSKQMMQDYKTNCVGPMLLIQAIIPLLEKAANVNQSVPVGCSRAAIINISTKVASIADNGMGGIYPYRTSKVALNMLSKNLAIEFAPKGIFVGMLHPGWVKTDMGSSNAPTSPQESVSGMIMVMEGFTEKDQAAFKDFQNKTIPW